MWHYFPGQYMPSYQLNRALSQAHYGGGEFAECLVGSANCQIRRLEGCPRRIAPVSLTFGRVATGGRGWPELPEARNRSRLGALGAPSAFGLGGGPLTSWR